MRKTKARSLWGAMIRDHLTYNAFPPIDPVFFPGIFEAIAAADEGDWEAEIELPNGKVLSAAAIIGELRLEEFVSPIEIEEGG